MLSLGVLLFVVSLLQHTQGDTSPKQLSCRNPKSMICTLQDVNSVNYREPLLPDMAKKHILQIKSGNITRFSKELASQLGDVERLQIGRLDIQFLFISPQLLHLSADGNSIRELVAESYDNSSQSFSMQYLNLMNNKLTNINVLKNFVNLKELLLEGNQLEFLEMDLFAGMINLTRLTLSRNKLSQLVTTELVELPALETLALGFNELTKLSVSNWVMDHLTDMELSHNKLVNLDRENFDQFVSLEKLALARNSWNCFWLNKALTNLSQKYINLTDRDESCEAMPIKDICCSMTSNLADQPEQSDLPERINRLAKQQTEWRGKFTQKVDSLATEWKLGHDRIQSFVVQREKAAEEEQEKMTKDDGTVTRENISDLEQQLEDVEGELLKLKEMREQHAKFVSIYTNMKFMVIAQKNRLLAEMKNVTQLQREMEAFKQSFLP